LAVQSALGSDPSHVLERLVGPASAVWLAIFVLPMFLFTPDLAQARRWDQVLCLNKRQIAFGEPDQVLDREVLEATYAGEIVEIPGSDHVGILPAHHH